MRGKSLTYREALF